MDEPSINDPINAPKRTNDRGGRGGRSGQSKGGRGGRGGRGGKGKGKGGKKWIFVVKFCVRDFAILANLCDSTEFSFLKKRKIIRINKMKCFWISEISINKISKHETKYIINNHILS